MSAVAARRAKKSVFAVAVAMLIAFAAPAAAWADSNDDLLRTDETLGTAVEAFLTVYADDTTSSDDVIAAAEEFTAAAASAQADFQRIADSAQGQVADFAALFAVEAGDMSGAAGDITSAFTAQDSDALEEAEFDLNAAFVQYSATADSYNAYLQTLGDPSYVGWLIVLVVAVVFLVLALVFALVTRRQVGLLPATTDKKGNVRQSSLARLRWLVVLWAGLFVVGAAIPFFQVAFAQPDANGEYTYRILWYPLAAGAVLSVVGVVQYFIAAAKVRREGSAPSHAEAATSSSIDDAPLSVPPVPPAPEATVPPAPAAPVVDAGEDGTAPEAASR